MAERRMFAKTIVLSDEFLDMPLSARCLYFTLGMFADDDGFVNSPKGIMRQCGASVDDMKILLSKRFILSFDSGVIVIKHWRINNYLRSDRYASTKYVEEKSKLKLNDNGSYTFDDNAEAISDSSDKNVGETTFGIPNMGAPSIGKDRLDKDSIDNIIVEEPDSKSRKQNGSINHPTIEEVRKYIKDQGYNVNADEWYNYYKANGWKVGRNPMKNWKSAVAYWNGRNGNSSKRNQKAQELDNFYNMAREFGES